MDKATQDAIAEASIAAKNFVNELIEIADKYKIDRNEFMQKNAKVFSVMAHIDYENYKKCYVN